MGALAPVPRICGREAEIQALGEALDRVAAGGPAIVLVDGEAGIGKTRLLAQVLDDAGPPRRTGHRVTSQSLPPAWPGRVAVYVADAAAGDPGTPAYAALPAWPDSRPGRAAAFNTTAARRAIAGRILFGC